MAEHELPEFDVRLEARGTEAWVIPEGDLDLAVAPELRESLSLARLSDASAIVIDLRELEFIDSTGLRTIVEAVRAKEGPPVELVPGNERVHGVFNVSGLSTQLPFRDA